MADVILIQKGDLKSSDFTNDNSNNKEGIGIRVSTDSGNLLQKRPTGLYYGVEAPPDTRNLYVSSSTGDDANKGTRTAPLRTIREAIIRNNVGTSFTIHLFEDDTHDFLGSWSDIGNGKIMSFRPYGPVMDDCNARWVTGSSAGWGSEELHRPTIRFIYDAVSVTGTTQREKNRIMYEVSPTSGVIHFYGIRFDQSQPKDLDTANRYLITPIGTDTRAIDTFFIGCNFLLAPETAVVAVGGNATVYFRWCVVENPESGGKLVLISSFGVLNLVIDTGPAQGTEQLPSKNGNPLHYRANTPRAEFAALIQGGDASRTTNFNIRTLTSPYV